MVDEETVASRRSALLSVKIFGFSINVGSLIKECIYKNKVYRSVHYNALRTLQQVFTYAALSKSLHVQLCKRSALY